MVKGRPDGRLLLTHAVSNCFGMNVFSALKTLPMNWICLVAIVCLNVLYFVEFLIPFCQLYAVLSLLTSLFPRFVGWIEVGIYIGP